MIQFASTFAGVFLSFLLWFGGTRFLQWRSDRANRIALERELLEEVSLNITMLNRFATEIPKMLQSKTIPVFLPFRMTLSVFHQAASTGQLRLFSSVKQQLRWRSIADVCESSNRFLENSELVVAISLLRSDGPALAEYRLSQLVESAKETKEFLQRWRNEIKEAK